MHGPGTEMKGGETVVDAVESLQRENEALRQRLAEAEEALRAIRGGEVDAIVVEGGQGPQIFSLSCAETIYRLAVETMGEGVVNVTADGRILFCNECFSQLVGTPVQHLMGRDVGDFLRPGELPSFRALLKKCVKQPVQARVNLLAPDGTVTATRLSGRALLQDEEVSLCLLVADLTDLERSARQINQLSEDKRTLQRTEAKEKAARLAALNLMEDAMADRQRAEAAMAALRESEELFRSTFENAAVGIAHQAPDGRWLRVNAQLCTITGYSREELLGKTFADITHPADVQSDVEQSRRLLAGEVPSYWIEKRFIRKDGAVVWITLTVSLARSPEGAPDYLIKIIRDISLRKQAQAELDASRQRLAGIIESAMDAIISIGADQRIVMFNRAAVEMFRCPEEEALGSPVERFIPERFRPSHRDRVEEFERGEKTMRTRAMGPNGNLTGLRATGEEFPIEASISRTDAGGERLFTVILRDITERLRAEQALREGEERLRLAAQATGFGTYDYSPAEGGSVWSPELFAICGVPEQEQPGSRLLGDLVHPLDREAFAATVQGALDLAGPGRHELEFRILRPDGEERWVRDVGQSFFQGEGQGRKVVRVIGTVQDVTRRKQTELRLQESLRELAETRDLAVRQERLATLGQLAGSVAHELRTPLAVISNTGYYLKAAIPSSDDDIRDSFEELERAVRSSDFIISELLDFVRDPSPVVNDFPVGRAVERALEVVQIPADVRLILPDAGHSMPVRANEDQVKRIFVNLLQNALQAMPQGGELEIRVSEAKGERVCVKIRDSGCGIPPENLPKIFEPLYTTKTKGIGLGLAISHRYAKLNQGWIFAESALGKGTTFCVILRQPAS